MYTYTDTRIHAREDDTMPTDEEIMAQYAAMQDTTTNNKQ